MEERLGHERHVGRGLLFVCGGVWCEKGEGRSGQSRMFALMESTHELSTSITDLLQSQRRHQARAVAVRVAGRGQAAGRGPKEEAGPVQARELRAELFGVGVGVTVGRVIG